MTRVKQADGTWIEIAGGTVAYHDKGGSLHVHTAAEPVFFEADAWQAFEVLHTPNEATVVDTAAGDVIFPEGFV
jgi:hypothetical protein